jgi:hypothetical protein
MTDDIDRNPEYIAECVIRDRVRSEECIARWLAVAGVLMLAIVFVTLMFP